MAIINANNETTTQQALETTLQNAVDAILTESSISPVIAPNGVPVYRVDRGGEGM